MAVSKSPEQDKEITDRVLKTLDVQPHETPQYYKYLDDAIDHLEFESPKVSHADFVNHTGSRTVHDKVDVSAIPAIHAAKKRAGEDFLQEVHKTNPSPEDLALAHKAWQDVSEGTYPELRQDDYVPMFHTTWKHRDGLPSVRNAGTAGFGDMTFEDRCISDNKMQSTAPGASLWSFIVHRVKHLGEYETATPEVRSQMHNGWREQQIEPEKAARENFPKELQAARLRRMSLPVMRRFLVESPQYVAGALRHQRDFHNSMLTHFAHVLQFKDGVPHIAVSRGLDSQEHGSDRTLASYSGDRRSNFGTRSYRYLVPLDNVWYSYDLGPEAVVHNDTEHEYVVDDEHPRIPLDENLKLPVVPNAFHSYDLSHPLTWRANRQMHVLDSALAHNVLPIWASEMTPSVILDLVSRKKYMSPEAREKLAQLPISPQAWADLQTPIGLDIAIHNHKSTPRTIPWNSLTNTPVGRRWLASRYPHTLPDDVQNKLAADALASNAAPRLKALLSRPDLRQDVRTALQKALENPGVSHEDFQDGWSAEHLFKGAK